MTQHMFIHLKIIIRRPSEKVEISIQIHHNSRKPNRSTPCFR